MTLLYSHCVAKVALHRRTIYIKHQASPQTRAARHESPHTSDNHMRQYIRQSHMPTVYIAV